MSKHWEIDQLPCDELEAYLETTAVYLWSFKYSYKAFAGSHLSFFVSDSFVIFWLISQFPFFHLQLSSQLNSLEGDQKVNSSCGNWMFED